MLRGSADGNLKKVLARLRDRRDRRGPCPSVDQAAPVLRNNYGDIMSGDIYIGEKSGEQQRGTTTVTAI